MPMELYEQNTKQWLCTTASQVFFMQLGFLCYEVGYVKPVWTQSIILKNIEDTFVGVLTFLALGYTLSESANSLGGIISIPENPLLIGVPNSKHDQVLISAFFASTCATIVSGGVLERMKNKAYITWCCLTILINYSFVSHWVWHSDGWLNKLGFVDGAGAIVVHSTAGIAALIPVWKLGARKESIDPYTGKLLPAQHASNPVINAIGALFLWYGWFAFNVASPIAFSKGIDEALSTTALVTVISPITAACSSFIWMHLGFVPLTFESLLSCLLCGLISITGTCHTSSPWTAAFIGIFSSIIYFIMSNIVRNKWKLDDPMHIISIHLFCGIFSEIAEGIAANDTYGTPGLLHGKGELSSFKHFGVQILGTVVVVTFNFFTSLFLWEIVLKRIIFRKTSIRVSILDIYLGTRLFDQNYDMALKEVLNCDSNAAKKMLFEFHQYIFDRYAAEQLDFLIVSNIFHKYVELSKSTSSSHKNITFDTQMSARHIISIINNYVDENGDNCINISGTQRSILLKIRKQLLFEFETDELKTRPSISLNDNHSVDTVTVTISSSAYPFKSGMDITKENVFESVFRQVWKIVLPHFTMFLRSNYEESKNFSHQLKVPFGVKNNWSVEWDNSLQKDTEKKIKHLVDMLPNDVDVQRMFPNKKRDSLQEGGELDENNNNNNNNTNNDYPIVFVDENNKKTDMENKSVVMIE